VKLFCQYCPYGFSNCYILGTEETDTPDGEHNDGGRNDAVIIDPGSMDMQILDFLENNNFNLTGVLITHDHLNHVHGLRTLLRIYNPVIYAVNRTILEHETHPVKDGDIIGIGRIRAEVISIPGHSSDSAVYQINNLLFTGDVLSAGLVGETASAYGAALQVNNLRTRILSLPGNYAVLPGHGPPSSLEAERRFNAGIAEADITGSRRPKFRVEL